MTFVINTPHMAGLALWQYIAIIVLCVSVPIIIGFWTRHEGITGVVAMGAVFGLFTFFILHSDSVDDNFAHSVKEEFLAEHSVQIAEEVVITRSGSNHVTFATEDGMMRSGFMHNDKDNKTMTLVEKE